MNYKIALYGVRTEGSLADLAACRLTGFKPFEVDADSIGEPVLTIRFDSETTCDPSGLETLHEFEFEENYAKCRFCRMAALALLPQAVVLTGGVAEKSPALVRHEAFAREFLRERGGRKELLAGIPVWLNRHPQAGLWGAARAGAAFAGAMQALPEGAIRS